MAYTKETLQFKSGDTTFVSAFVHIYQDVDNPSMNPPYAEIASIYVYSPTETPLKRLLTPYISVGGSHFGFSGITWRSPVYDSANNRYWTWALNLDTVPTLPLTGSPGDEIYTSLRLYAGGFGDICCSGSVYLPKLITVTPPATVRLNYPNHFTCTPFVNRYGQYTSAPSGTGALKPSYKGCTLYVDESTPMDQSAAGQTISGFYWYPSYQLAQPGDFTDNVGQYYLMLGGLYSRPWTRDSHGGFGGVTLRWLSLASGSTFEGVIQYNETPPASCTPTVTLTATEVSGQGILAQYGRYIKGKSQVKYTAAIACKYGAEESWFDLTVGYLYTKNKTLTFWPEANGTAVAHAEDDHNGEKEVSATYRVYDYWTPALTQAIHRCRSDGTRDDAGSYCLIEWEINIAPLGSQNSRSLIIQHPAGTATPTLNSYTASGELIVAADPERSYEITYILSDDFETVTRTVQLSTAGVIMDIFRGGHGISFGKVAEKDYTFEISSELATILNTQDAKLINLVDALEALAQATGVDIYVHDQ